MAEKGFDALTAQEYTRKLREALGMAHHTCHLFQGKQGAERIAREYGRGLAELAEQDEAEALEELRNSYISLCVRGYNLNPPINAKDWMKEVTQAFEEHRQKWGYC